MSGGMKTRAGIGTGGKYFRIAIRNQKKIRQYRIRIRDRNQQKAITNFNLVHW